MPRTDTAVFRPDKTHERIHDMQNRHIRSFITYLLVLLMVSALLLPIAAVNDTADTQPDMPGDTESAIQHAPPSENDTPTSGDNEIVSIDIKTFGKDTYLEGEYFDPSLYILRVTYADGTTEEIGSSDFSYSPAGRLVTDGVSEDVTVEFSYKGKVKKTYVTVKRPVSLGIVRMPQKMQYNEGSSFDPTGLALSLEYPDGMHRQPDEDEYTIDIPSSLTSDITSAEISCYGKTAVLNGIDVIKMVSMVIIKQPDKLVYYEGEKFDPSGMMVIATFENSSIGRLLEEGDYTISGPVDSLVPDSSDRQMLTLTLSVGSISEKLSLTVYGFESFVITPPVKSDYYYGDTFSAEGLAVKAKYVNGEERDITNDITVTAPEIMTSGSEVRISYLGYEESIISVHEVRILHIRNQPKSLIFREGSLLTDGDALAEMLITVEYDDGTEVPLHESEYTVSPSGALTLDNTKLIVTYRGLTAHIDITVLPARAVQSIQITKAPEITQYISNQPVDVTGMEVTVTYEDGTQELIPLDKLQITPAPGSAVKVTDTRIKIVYAVSEKLVYNTYLPIEVSPKKVISLSILTPPTKLEYTEGEKFDTTGMEILAIYNDGTSAQITTYTCSPSEPLTLSANASEETISITISYVDCTAIQNITVKQREISSIEVAQNPAKLEYAPGEVFDPDGLILKINYVDGTTALVEHGASAVEFLPAGALTADVTEITLSFRGKTIALPVTVREPVITEPPETSTDETTVPAPSSDTSEPEVTTSLPGEVTTGTINVNPIGGNTIMVVWIAIIAVIVILLVVLIVYYKRNFT